jgi:hypothetical protein
MIRRLDHYDVFLSYSRVDEQRVEELAIGLRDYAPPAEPFFDRWALGAGGTWQTEIDAALGACEGVAIVVGPGGMGPWQKEEVQAALLRAVDDAKRFRVIPVLLPGASAADVSGFLKTRTWVDFRRGLGDEATLITMRGDFLESALACPELRDLLQGRQYLLGEIADADLLKVIAEPAREVGAFFENALPARIIDHIRENRRALALLEDALFELWRRRRGVWLTHQAYEENGGIST